MAKQTTKTPEDELKALRSQAAAALTRSGCMAYKEDVLIPYGVTGLREMTAEQLRDLCTRLNTVVSNKQRADEATRKARSTVLYLLDDLGVKAKGGEWKKVNETLLNPRISGKLLYEMNLEELKTCAVRLRMILKKRIEKQTLNDFLAKNN